jgi:DNA recombination protein RmuC
MTMLLLISVGTSVLTCVLVCILMFTGRATADLTPIYQTLREGRDELRNILGGQNQTLEIRLNSADTKLTANTRQQTADLWGVAERLRTTLSEGLEKMRQGDETKLEQMRQTVDEKLQSTLETRLTNSFKTVGDQLEQVYRGLGEMQSLATGVGDLKRVLTNVKVRGSWGEAQLGNLLADFLTTEQYEPNVHIAGAAGMVEFAIKLPGKDESGEPVWLPIDSKFPQEDYERLLNAQAAGDPNDVERWAAALERAIRLQAKTIYEKYVRPLHATDFAIMFLPIEGLFAETVRRAGLCADLQSAHHIMLAGPTTLRALLTSLQLGFRTLAIEKHATEVWKVLGAAKAEFGNYADVWKKLERQLGTAQNTVQESGRRTRAVERKLRNVETAELPNGGNEYLALPSYEEDESVDAAEA